MEYAKLADDLIASLYGIVEEKDQPMNSSALRGRGFVLIYLAHHGGKAYPGEISKAMDVTTSRITAVLASLEEQGYIKRMPSESDRRKVLVTLTEAGKEFMQARIDETRGLAINLLEELGEHDAQEYVRITKHIAEIHARAREGKQLD